MVCQTIVPDPCLRRKIPTPGVDPAAKGISGTRYAEPILVQNASMDVFLLGDFWRCSVPVGLGSLSGDRPLY